MRLLLLLFLTLNLLNAQKIALLIGNSQYSHLAKLSSPSKDIPALAQKLRGMNFEVIELYDLDKKAMKRAIKNFKMRLQRNPNAIALFYYSGHGSQAYGESYLIPIDGDTRDEADVESDGVEVEWIAKKMAIARTKANILFLDACRDVPTATMGNGTKGLGQVKRQPSSTLILYSTSKNKTAKDDRVFNRTVLSKLGANMAFDSLANSISYLVAQKTNGEQRPELLSTGLPPMLCLSGSCNQPQEVKVVEKIVYRDRVVDAIPVPVPAVAISTSKWLKPSDSVCRANGGKIDKYGICEATWQNAKKICSASGGQLPSRDDFHKVITDCGGIADADSGERDKNRNNSSYQSCYKQKGFISTNFYWSSTTYASDTSYAWVVGFYYGYGSWDSKTDESYVRCVRGQ